MGHTNHKQLRSPTSDSMDSTLGAPSVETTKSKLASPSPRPAGNSTTTEIPVSSESQLMDVSDLANESEEDAEQLSIRQVIFRGMSSWMVSMVIHLTLVLMLAIVTLGVAGRDSVTLQLDDTVGEELVSFEVLIDGASENMMDPALAEFENQELEIDPQSSPLITEALEVLTPPEPMDSYEAISTGGLEQRADSSPTKGLEGTAEFFGVTGSGSRFVFIIDCSGSMDEYRRWKRAKRELINSINGLSDQQKFLILLYNFESVAMNDEPPSLVEATKTNQRKAIKWLNKRKPIGSTYAGTALKKAFQLKPDAIFLLSDGEFDDLQMVDAVLASFNGSPEERGQFNGKYAAESDSRRITPVHTISLGSHAGSWTMKVIADQNNGINTVIDD